MLDAATIELIILEEILLQEAAQHEAVLAAHHAMLKVIEERKAAAHTASRMCRKRLSSGELVEPENGAWQRIKEARKQAGFYVITSMSPDAFDRLYELLFPDRPVGNESTGGRRLKLPGGLYDYLALTMCFLHTTMTLDELALLFGVTSTTISRHIRNILTHMSIKLPTFEESAISWPDLQEINDLAGLINRQYPVLEHMYAFADGVCLPIQSATDLSKQELFYNGRKAGTVINNFIVWSPNGKNLYARYNCYGKHHDSRLAVEFYNHIRSSVPLPYHIVADAAFQTVEGKVRKPFTEKDAAIKRQLLRDERASNNPDNRFIDSLAVDLATNAYAISARQASEWGNRALLASCRRLTIPLPNNDATRELIVKCSLHLHNFRTSMGCTNQIRTVYERAAPSDWKFVHRGLTNHEQYIEANKRQRANGSDDDD